MIRFLLACVVGLACAFGSGLARAETPRLTAERPVVDVDPRQTIALAVRVENPASTRLQGGLHVAVPDGWRLLTPPPAIDLRPAESQTLLLPVLVGARAPAGSYAVDIALQAEHATASLVIEVRVAPVRALVVEVVRVPSLVVDEAYVLEFELRNDGNVPQTVGLTASSSHMFPLSIDVEQIDLAPYASTTVVVQVGAPPERIERSVQHTARLSAAALGDDTVRASAGAGTEVVVARTSPDLGYHWFDLRLKASAGLDSRGLPGDARSALGAFRVEVQGSGRLHEDRPGILEVSLANRLDGSDRRNYLTYRTPDFHASVGDQGFSIGPLLPDVRGFGVTTGTGWGPLEGASVFGVIHEGAVRGGARLEAQASDGVELVAQAVGGAGVAAVALRARAVVPTHAHGSFTVSLEPALDLLAGAPALAVGVNARGARFDAHAGLTYRAEGYLDRETWTTSLSAKARVRVLRDPALDLEVRYGDTFDGAGASRRRVETRVSGGATDAGWSVGYRYGFVAGDDIERSHAADLSVRGRLAPDVTMEGRAEVELVYDLVDFNHERSVTAEAGVAFPLLAGRASAGVHARYNLLAGGVGRATVDGSWEGELSAGGAHLRVGAEVALLPSLGTELELGLRHPLAHGATLATDLRADLGAGRAPRIRASASVDVPVRINLGRRAGMAEVRGSVTDGVGTTVQHAVVAMAGYAAVTASDGSFVFPGVPIGRHVLVLRGLEPGLVTLPASPLEVEVPESGAAVDVQVVRAASLRGRVEIAAAEGGAAAGAIVGAGSGGHASAAGVAIVLEGPGGSRRLTVDESGVFHAGVLTPGAWEASIVESSLPPYHRAVMGTATVTLAGGQAGSIVLTIEPVRRTVQFTGGGELGK